LVRIEFKVTNILEIILQHQKFSQFVLKTRPIDAIGWAEKK